MSDHKPGTWLHRDKGGDAWIGIVVLLFILWLIFG